MHRDELSFQTRLSNVVEANDMLLALGFVGPRGNGQNSFVFPSALFEETRQLAPHVGVPPSSSARTSVALQRRAPSNTAVRQLNLLAERRLLAAKQVLEKTLAKLGFDPGVSQMQRRRMALRLADGTDPLMLLADQGSETAQAHDLRLKDVSDVGKGVLHGLASASWDDLLNVQLSV